METKLKQKSENQAISQKKSDLYKEQYDEDFVDKWDQLIDWNARGKGEGDFFIRELQKRGCKKILDAAAGTGYHSIKLQQQNFEVHSVDGSENMLMKAFQNGKKQNLVLRTIHADWRWLTRDIHEKYDAVICLGNSFTHLFKEEDRRKTLAEFYAVLKHDGILILDQRNYDVMLDEGFKTKHSYYYAGENVKAEPEFIQEDLVRFRYQFPDDSIFNLNMFPLKKEYTKNLIKEAGFQSVTTYGDFQETYRTKDPDYLIHIANKL
jgi:SAM-dependent methyltransferase